MKKSTSFITGWFERIAGSGEVSPVLVWSLFLLAILVPVVVMPGFSSIYGSLKHVILVVLASSALFGWSVHTYKARKWDRRASHFVWLPVLVLIGVVISAIASPVGYAGWVGTGSQGFTAVIPVFALTIVYLLALHIGDHKKVLRLLSFGALPGGLLALLVGVFGLMELSFLPEAIRFPGFSPTGTTESLTILGSVMSVFAIGIWIVDDHAHSDTWLPTRGWRYAFRIVGSLILASSLVLLLLTDTQTSQIVLLVGTGTIVALGLFMPKRFTNASRMMLPMGLFALSLLMLLVALPTYSKIPVEVGPNLSTTWQVTKAALGADGYLFGSGPGSFDVDMARFRPAELNGSPFWQARFDHGSMHWLNLLATWGIVPLALLLLFICWVAYMSFEALVLKNDREDWQTIAVLFSVWVMLVASMAVYSSNITLQVLFWLITGLLVSHISRHRKALTFNRDKRASLVTSFLFVGTGVLLLAGVLMSLQWFYGEASIAKATALQKDGAQIEEVRSHILRAARSNPWDASYYRAAALSDLKVIDSLDPSMENLLETQGGLIREAIGFANRAVMLNVRDARNYEVARMVHMKAMSFDGAADTVILDAAIAARQLDPNNPARHYRVAQAFINSADRAAVVLPDDEQRPQVLSGLLSQAESAIESAIALKSSYAPAYYTRTLILERQGRLEEAIFQLEQLVVSAPRDAVLRFELGVMHLNAGQTELATQDFETAVLLSPTFGNAKWYLASMYESDGRIEDARIQLQDVLILDPTNDKVINRLKLLKDGGGVDDSRGVEPLEVVE